MHNKRPLPNDPDFAAPHRVTRRSWLQSSTLGGLSALVLFPQLAQDTPLRQAMRRMAVMTGAELPEQWEPPTAALVEVILNYSASLRALELGETEPATFFLAR